MERISSVKALPKQKTQSDRKKRKTVYVRRKDSPSRHPTKHSISAKSKAKSSYTDSYFEDTEESTKTSIRRFEEPSEDHLFTAIEDFLNLKDLKIRSNVKKKGKKMVKSQNGQRYLSPESKREINLIGSRGGFEGISDSQV
jgi:anti-sigma factor ChrR (cupin superfamily)